MKTSDKILSATLFTAFLILGGVHLAMYARFRSGHYTVSDNDRTESLPLEKVRYVSVHNASVVIHPGRDVPPKLAYNMTGKAIYDIEKKGDTLLITDTGKWHRSDVHLYLGGGITVAMSHSAVSVEDDRGKTVRERDGNRAPSFHFILDSTELSIGTVNTGLPAPLCFDSLDITAKNQSSVNLEIIELESLDVKLKNSRLDETAVKTRSFSLRTDTLSVVSLSGENLLKAKVRGAVDSSGRR